MEKNKIPRPGTSSEQVMRIMEGVRKLGYEAEAPKAIEKGTLQALVNRLRREVFNDEHFYTRTKPCGTIVIGLWKN